MPGNDVMRSLRLLSRSSGGLMSGPKQVTVSALHEFFSVRFKDALTDSASNHTATMPHTLNGNRSYNTTPSVNYGCSPGRTGTTARGPDPCSSHDLPVAQLGTPASGPLLPEATPDAYPSRYSPPRSHLRG